VLQILDVVDYPIELFIKPPQIDEDEIIGFSAHDPPVVRHGNEFKPTGDRDRLAAATEETGLSGSAPSTPPDWRDSIFAVIKAAGITQIGYVPDAGHARLIDLVVGDPAIRAIPLTSEQEGIAVAAGAWLGGQRSALLMQSSGVGNCVNMLTLAKNCRFPLVVLVTMRGEWAEFNPWQVPMGQKTAAALELMDVLVYRVEHAADAAETVAAAIDIAYAGDVIAVVLLSQRLIGAKRWAK
jgi:sulfopyruvate decarboxylase alpha subunit